MTRVITAPPLQSGKAGMDSAVAAYAAAVGRNRAILETFTGRLLTGDPMYS